MKLFVYGSLKKGHFNHERFGMDTLKFIGEKEIKGWKMLSLGAYPGIVRSDTIEDKVKGEVYEVDVEGPIYRMISAVEYSAGFEEYEPEKGMILFRYLNYEGNEPVVPGGEWVL